MTGRSPIVRILACAARGDTDGAVRALDRLTPWKGVAEIAADIAGPPLVRALACAGATPPPCAICVQASCRSPCPCGGSY